MCWHCSQDCKICWKIAVSHLGNGSKGGKEKMEVLLLSTEFTSKENGLSEGFREIR